MNSVKENKKIIEAGGPVFYSRKELIEIIRNEVMYDKFAFLTEVLLHDLIAPQIGQMNFEDYIRMKTVSVIR